MLFTLKLWSSRQNNLRNQPASLPGTTLCSRIMTWEFIMLRWQEQRTTTRISYATYRSGVASVSFDLLTRENNSHLLTHVERPTQNLLNTYQWQTFHLPTELLQLTNCKSKQEKCQQRGDCCPIVNPNKKNRLQTAVHPLLVQIVTPNKKKVTNVETENRQQN